MAKIRMSIAKMLGGRTDPENLSLSRFVKSVAKTVPNGACVLDAGSGSKQYSGYFSHAKYFSIDFMKSKRAYTKPDMVGDVELLPLKTEIFDAILNTQVLEHVPHPDSVISEFYRILKPKGRLFLTVPQDEGVHEAPYDFFRYTRFGLANLLTEKKFKNLDIKPRGGVFWQLAFISEQLPHIMIPKAKNSISNALLIVIRAPFIAFFGVILPFIFFHLDWLDKDKHNTLGYECVCEK